MAGSAAPRPAGARDRLVLSVALDDDQVATLAAALAEHLREDPPPARCAGASEYLTVPEAAALLRCKAQRVYDLLSQGRLRRYKDGSRVLVREDELRAHVRGAATRARM